MLKAASAAGAVVSGTEEAGSGILGTSSSATGPGAVETPGRWVDAEYEETMVTCCE